MAARKRAGLADEPAIVVRGAREHNLKNVNVELPRDKLVVFTGISGSGKSSLAFDTIYAEGQRRYVESLSAVRPPVPRSDGQARRRRDRGPVAGDLDRPEVGEQEPASTVGTITEVYDYLRLLYARIGVQHCPNDGTKLQRQTPQQIVDRILQLPEGTRFQVLAPVVRGRKGEYDTLLDDLSGPGLRACPDRRRDGRRSTSSSSATNGLARYEQHKIEVVVDRLGAPRGPRAAAHRLVGDGARSGRRRRRGRADRPGRRRPARDAHVLAAPRVPGVRHELRRAGAAQLLVQLAVRRVRDVRRAGHHVRGRSRARRPRSRPVAQRRRDLAVAQRPHPVLHAHARVGRRQPRHRPRRAVGLAHRQAAEGRPVRHQRQADGEVQEPLRPQPVVLHRVRGCDPLDQAPPRGIRQRLGPRAVRGLHAPGAVQRVRRGAAQAGVAGGHRQRQEHRRGLRAVDRRVGEVPRRARAQRARADDRRAGHQGGQRPSRVPPRRRARLPDAVAGCRHARRRRGTADPPRQPDRVGAGRHALRARRAVDRAPPTRQPSSDRHAHAPPRPRQHGDRRRARRGDDPRERLDRRHRPRRRRARRRGRVQRTRSRAS